MSKNAVLRSIEKWKTQDSAEIYGVDNWGRGYYSIGANGNLLVHPEKDPNRSIDLRELLSELTSRGIQTPVLLRFPGILRHRLEEIYKAFDKAIKDYEYRGNYSCIYPIKVNQQSHVVQEYLEFGRQFNFGIEAGSKPELLAILALVEDDETPIVCNGFKDDEFIETVILASKVGRFIIPIVEKFSELEMIIRYAEKHNVRPAIGVRAKLASRGVGRWESSAGLRSKFGLTIPEILKAIQLLKEKGMEDCLQLLHFHMGSQVSNIRNVKAAITEAARIYGNMKKSGAGMKYLDVGGGLAVDYDGSQTNYSSSMNYTLEEYANDVIFRVQSVCDDMEVDHPTIFSESGRAIISYHSLLTFNVLGRSIHEDMVFPPNHFREDDEETPQPLVELRNIAEGQRAKNILEDYHDAAQFREEAINLFNSGYLDLQGRAEAESLFWRICAETRETAHNMSQPPSDLDGIEDLLADTYFCNFSVFQSMPDHWAIEQLFPVMPIHRLDEEPTRRGVLADITCDSDGKIDRFVHHREIKKTLELHDLTGEPYYLGVFLIGAYQEILGDLHNLLGDTNAVHVSLDDEKHYVLDHVVEGDTVSEVLSYVQFDVKEMTQKFRKSLERAVRRKRITAEESGLIQRFYIDAINGYTYLEEPSELSILPQPGMPAT